MSLTQQAVYIFGMEDVVVCFSGLKKTILQKKQTHAK